MVSEYDDIKEPEDLGIKIMSKEEKAWADILEGAEKEIALSRRMIIINKGVVKTAKRMMKKEKLK